jgi:L-fucose isomerase-like protein
MNSSVTPRVGLIIYGVHKDGLQDPMGTPFIDDVLIANAKQSLLDAGLVLTEHDVIVASKEEAREAFARFKKMDEIDALVLFSGTWVWASHMIAAIRDFSFSGKGLVIWTHPGSQGWRPVGGLVLHGGLKEVGIQHRLVYGAYDDPVAIGRILSYCRASHMRNKLNMSTLGAFGGRGMGQTVGVADPSQWMRVFGIDIDTRDTSELIDRAENLSSEIVQQTRDEIQPLFSAPIPDDEVSDRSIRLYMAIRETVEKEGWDMYTIQSFPGLADVYSATCFAQSMMLENRIGTSTLSDFNTALTVKLLTDLSVEPVYYGDLQHFDKTTNEIKIIGDGACPPSLAGEAGPAKFAEHGIPTEGDAGGLSIDLVCKPGQGVLARLGRTKGKFEMILARCTVFEPAADEIDDRRLECGIPFWPHAFVTVDASMDELIEAWNNEYAVLGYGEHLYDDLVAFCELTGISLIAL